MLITTLLITQLIKNQHTTFRCQQADILFTSEPRVQSDVSHDPKITLSHVWLSWKVPVFRFMVFLVFRIHSASLIHLVCRSSSLWITLTPSQSITWFSFTAWSVIADLCVTLLARSLSLTSKRRMLIFYQLCYK